LRGSKIMQMVWAYVVCAETSVLVWVQVGIPYLAYHAGQANFQYPSAGATLDWAYLLVTACLGLGSVVLRAGPGKGSTFADARAATIKQKGEGG
jgi:hypothetical protein